MLREKHSLPTSLHRRGAKMIEDDGTRGLRAPEFLGVGPTFVCPLAPLPEQLFITAAENGTTQR